MADLEKTRKNLENRGFRAHVFATGAEAADYLAQTLHNTCIGIGGSVTIDEIGVYDRLSADNDVIWRWKKPTPDSRERGAAAETFLCSANGVSETGEIVNIDGNCNRIASQLYGGRNTVFVLGVNKIVKDVPAALERIRTVAAKKNCLRFGYTSNPCVTGGDCRDCPRETNICHATSIISLPPRSKNVYVIIVDKELGY